MTNTATNSDSLSAEHTTSPSLAPYLHKAGVSVGIVGFLFLLYWNIYADRFQPIVTPNVRLFPYGAMAGGLLFVLLYFGVKIRGTKSSEYRDSGPDHPPENFFSAFGVHPIIIVLGMSILGGIVVQAWAWTLNAWFDRSPAQQRPIEMLGRTVKTHKLIFCTYELKYRFVDDPKGDSFTFKCSKDELDSCDRQFGQVLVREGAFGWPWIETVKTHQENP